MADELPLTLESNVETADCDKHNQTDDQTDKSAYILTQQPRTRHKVVSGIPKQVRKKDQDGKTGRL